MGNLSPGKSPVKPPHPTRARNSRRLSEPTPGGGSGAPPASWTRRFLGDAVHCRQVPVRIPVDLVAVSLLQPGDPEGDAPWRDIPATGGGAIRCMGAVRSGRPRRNEARNRPPHDPPPHRRGLTRELDRIDTQSETSPNGRRREFRSCSNMERPRTLLRFSGGAGPGGARSGRRRARGGAPGMERGLHKLRKGACGAESVAGPGAALIWGASRID